MTRPVVLAVAALVVVLALHPWTWAAHGMRDVIVPACVLVVVAMTIGLIALRLGDLRLPARTRLRPVRKRGTAADATRAAEELLRKSRRR